MPAGLCNLVNPLHVIPSMPTVDINKLLTWCLAKNKLLLPNEWKMEHDMYLVNTVVVQTKSLLPCH